MSKKHMNKKHKFIIIAATIVLAVLLTTIFLGAQKKNASTEKEIVKIGVAVPLTKDYAFLGESIKNALILAQEQLPENTKYKYELIFEDTQLDPVVAASAVQKLINVDKVDAIISFNSGVGNIISPLAEENHVVHMGIASDMNVAKGKYNFIHWTPPSEESKKFIEELERRNITRVAILSGNMQAEKVIADALAEEAKNTSIVIVSTQFFNPKETDFKTILLKAEEAKPEILLLLTGSDNLELMAKQIVELGIDTPITSIENFEFTDHPELFEGRWYIQTVDATSEFKSQYLARFSKNFDVGAPNAYDEFNLLVTAYESSTGPKPTHEDIVASLINIKNFTGAMGELAVSDEGIVLSKAIVKEVRNGKYIVLNETNRN
jgi:branched-chain amino acid transport system substrate-binding protein